MSDGGRLDPINRRSLSDQVADILKDRIISLELPPGARLRMDALAEDLMVSRTPIREGLQQLMERGLVSYDGNNYTVRIYSREDVEEVYEIRIALEVLAAQLAAEHADDRLLEELEAVCAETARCLDARSAEQPFALDLRFHELVARASGNGRLYGQLAGLKEQVWAIRRRLFQLYEGAERVEAETLQEHRAILDRLRACDRQGAGEAMARHLEKASSRTLSVIPGRDIPTGS